MNTIEKIESDEERAFDCAEVGSSNTNLEPNFDADD